MKADHGKQEVDDIRVVVLRRDEQGGTPISRLRFEEVGAQRRTPAFRVQGSGFRVQGSGFRVQGSGLRVQGGLGCWMVLGLFGVQAWKVIMLDQSDSVCARERERESERERDRERKRGIDPRKALRGQFHVRSWSHLCGLFDHRR